MIDVIAIIHLIPKWRNIHYFCLYANWASGLPRYKPKILFNSADSIEAMRANYVFSHFGKIMVYASQ